MFKPLHLQTEEEEEEELDVLLPVDVSWLLEEVTISHSDFLMKMIVLVILIRVEMRIVICVFTFVGKLQPQIVVKDEMIKTSQE